MLHTIKIEPDDTCTIYVGGVYEVEKAACNGAVTHTRVYYPAGGAMRVDGTLYYVLKDHLGSASMVTDVNGNPVGEQRYYPFGETRFTSGNMFTDKLFTSQREITELGIYHYGARFYSPTLGRFLSADTIVPGYANPQSLNRFSYVLNNPIRYNDPSGHKTCEDVNSNGKCTGDKLARLLDYVHKDIVDAKRDKEGNIRYVLKKKNGTVMDSFIMTVRKAASIFGKDWNGFFDATDFVFSGHFGQGAGTMLRAHQSDFHGYFDGDTGFHSDFVDESNQVRHFWVAFASAADPYGDNLFGGAVASIGNQIHDKSADNPVATPSKTDGVTVNDYKLSITGIDIAKQIGNEIKIPSDLAKVLLDRLGTDGPGYIGPEVDSSTWFTPWY